MGVTFDLQAKVYTGSPEAEHQLLINQIVDKVIVIDGAQWLHHCDGGARAATFTERNSDEDAFALNAVDMFASRIIQILRYGASPVVVCSCCHVTLFCNRCHWE